jgi:hypothetical protein
MSAREVRLGRRKLGWATVGMGSLTLSVGAALSRVGTDSQLVNPLTITALAVLGVALLFTLSSFVWPRDNVNEHFTCRLVSPNEMASVRAFVEQWVGHVFPSEAAIQALLDKNPDICYIVESRENLHAQNTNLVGCFSILPLLQGTIRRLEAGDIQGTGINAGSIARRGGVPRGFYIGVVAAIDSQAARTFTLSELEGHLTRLCRKHCVNKLFARPVTHAGLRLVTKRGFKCAADRREPRMNLVCYKHWGTD